MSSEPGQVKNIVDALRRSMQLPVSQIAGGQNTVGATFTVSLNPPTIQAPGSAANSYQSTVDVASVNAFTGIVTLTEADTLPTGSVGFGISGATLQVAPNADGLTELNVNITASTPSGTYSVTVTGTTTINGKTITVSAVMSVIVGAGAGKCVNANDCGTGLVCVNGQCYGIIDNTVIHPGLCTAKDTAICKGENLCAAVNGPDGNCYCSHCSNDCAQYNSQCQAKFGPCSTSTLVNGLCLCTKCNNTANPITVTCPSNVTACLDATTPKAQTAVSQFTVTNTDALSAYNINMTMTPVGQKCSCCGLGPSLSTGGGYSIGPGGAVNTVITVPLTCASTKCYSWNLKITVALAISNTVVQSFTCPFQICTTTQPCFILDTTCQPNGLYDSACACSGGNCWSPSASTSVAMSAVNIAPTCSPDSCPGSCVGPCGGAGAFNVRLRSINGFAGTVNLTWVTNACNAFLFVPPSFPSSVILTANETLTLAADMTPAVAPVGNRQGHNTSTTTVTMTVTATSGSLTQIIVDTLSETGIPTC